MDAGSRKAGMRRFFFIAVTAAALGILFASCRSQKDALLGRWTSVARGKGGIATVVEFRPDSSFVSTSQMMLDCSYQFQGTQLVLSMTDARTGQASHDLVETRVSDDKLILKAPWDGAEYQMQRSEPPPASAVPVVGKWASGATGANPATAEFTADGKLLFRQRLKSAAGKYLVSGDSLTLNFEGAAPQKGKFELEADSLILTPEGGPSQVFKRSHPGD